MGIKKSGRLLEMKYGADFTIEPLPKRHGHKIRVKPSHVKASVMDTPKQFKTSPEVREYMRNLKRKERAEKAKK